LWSQSRPGDWLIVFVFVALAGGSFWLGGLLSASANTAKNLVAAVTVGNREVTTLSLSTPSDFVVRGTLGEMLLQVTNRRIRVLRSTCPNQVCVRQGAVHRPGEMLVCVPNRLVVLIRRASEMKFTQPLSDSTTSDTVTSDYDAATY
jgi:hypothetical protein